MSKWNSWICISVFGVMVASAGAQEKGKTGLTLAVTPEKSEFTLGVPVTVKVLITNGSSADLQVEMPDTRGSEVGFAPIKEGDPDVAIVSDNGSELYWSSVISIKPKHTWVGHYILDEWLTFKAAGNFNLRCSLTVRGESLGNNFAVSIKPADPQKLQAAASALVEKLRKNKDGEKKPEYLNVLCFFRSASVIPQFRTAIGFSASPGVLEKLIETVRRIGGAEGEAALRELTMSKNEKVASTAKFELAQIKARTRE